MEERDGLSRLLSIRDLDMRDNLWALSDQPSKREAPDSFGRILSIHNSEVLRSDDTLTGLRPIKNEVISKHSLDRVEVVRGHQAPELAHNRGWGF